MNSLKINNKDFYWIREELEEAYKSLSKKEQIFFDKKRLKFPILYPLNTLQATKEDDSVFVVYIDDRKVILFDDIEELFSVGILEQNSIVFNGNYTTLSECISFISSNVNDNSGKKDHSYGLIEIKFSFLEKEINRYDFLQKCYSSIIKSKVLNKGFEHGSSHYIENIVYKWAENNVKIKFYIDDYSEYGWCFDIFSENQNDSVLYALKILDFLMKNYEIDINVIKN